MTVEMRIRPPVGAQLVPIDDPVSPARCEAREVGAGRLAAGNAENGISDRGVYARRTGDHGVARNRVHR
jgi:hypothetical protein